MNIYYDSRSWGKLIKVEEGSFNCEIDIESREWERDEAGSMKCVSRDVSDEAMEEITRLLYDMADDRKKDFDSSDLIESLFEKLPKDKAIELASRLGEQYCEDED